MNPQTIEHMQNEFDALAMSVPDENVAFRFSRDLRAPLGYARRENVLAASNWTMDSCNATGYAVPDQVRGATKMIEKGAPAEVT